MKTISTRTKKTTKKKSNLGPALRLRAAGLMLAVAVLPGVSPLAPARALQAQQKKEPTQRLIEGTVVDKADKPLPGAVVFLKDAKALSVKTYLADQAGHFRFGQLSMATDYDLWATMNGKRSKTKSISSFNAKPTLDYTLKLDAESAAADAPPAAPNVGPQAAAAAQSK
jgi:hypothetical protein